MTNGDVNVQFDEQLVSEKIRHLRAVSADPGSTNEQKLDVLMGGLEVLMMMNLSDHPKLMRMWAYARPLMWAGIIAVGGLILLAVQGKLAIQILK